MRRDFDGSRTSRAQRKTIIEAEDRANEENRENDTLQIGSGDPNPDFSRSVLIRALTPSLKPLDARRL